MNDVRPEPGRDLGGVRADDAAAEDHRHVAGGTPGTPPSRMPRPSNGRSRYFAPSWMLIRPATSLIGVSSGSVPFASLIVS